MKSARATVIAILFSLGAALIVANANAQSPSATPTVGSPVGIPETAPQWFIAEGSTQDQWTAIRHNCSRKISEATRRGQLSAAQRSVLPPLNFTHQDLMLCAHLSMSPSATPTTSAPVGSIPENAPQYWSAEGGTQGEWTAMREHCRAVLFGKPNKFDHSEWEGCVHLSSAFSARPGPSMTPLAPGPGISPTPLPTPLPPAPPVGPQSSDAAASGPPTVGANFLERGWSEQLLRPLVSNNSKSQVI